MFRTTNLHNLWSLRDKRPNASFKKNEAKLIWFLYFKHDVLLLWRKWKKSIYRRKLTGRFLRGLPLKFDSFEFDCASRIERQKFDTDSYVEPWHVPNLMHTLSIHYINYVLPRILRVSSTWHAHKACIQTRWREKMKVLAPLVWKRLNILVSAATNTFVCGVRYNCMLKRLLLLSLMALARKTSSSVLEFIFPASLSAILNLPGKTIAADLKN